MTTAYRTVLALAALSIFMLWSRVALHRLLLRLNDPPCPADPEDQLEAAVRYYQRFPDRFARFKEWLKDIRSSYKYQRFQKRAIKQFLYNVSNELGPFPMKRRRTCSKIKPKKERMFYNAFGADVAPKIYDRAGNNRYCDRFSLDHTLCMFPDPGEFPVTMEGEFEDEEEFIEDEDYDYESPCKTRLEAGLEDSDQAAIIYRHNLMRSRVASGLETRGINGAQPPAANMMEMEWDSELALIAQRWADQCFNSTDPHDYDRRTIGHAWRRVGQNVYWSFNATLDPQFTQSENASSSPWERVIDAWASEVEQFDPDRIGAFYDNDDIITNHYSAIVWASTRRVGCGQALFVCTHPKTEKHGYCFKFVCNYGPGGNVLGQPVYIEGEAASECPPHTKRSPLFRFLCRQQSSFN